MRTTMLRTLGNAIRYLHLEAQLAQSETEFEDYSIALRLLGLLCDGWNGGPGLLNVACAYATGLPHAKYLRRRAEREEFQRLELARCIPDYDYSLEPRLPDRDPTDGRRHSRGAPPRMDTQAIKEAAARLGITEQAIYRRLRQGWTLQEATSEPSRQGSKLYATRFCDLAGQASEGDDPNSISGPDANDARASERFGVWATAEARDSVPGRAGAPGQAALLAPNRRKPPGRVSSAAQRSQVATMRARVQAGALYFGA